MRTSSLSLALLLLTGCGASEPAGEAAAKNQAVATVDDNGRIDCALQGKADFASSCTLERSKTADGMILTVRQPDGGFHRLRQVDDGRGVVAADGAEDAKVSVLGNDRIEVAIGDARYRLPARVGPLPK